MKLSKFFSLLLVPLLLLQLALPAYADEGTGDSYLIYFETGGGTGIPITATTTLEGKLSSLPTPTMSGYTFEGWYTDDLSGDRITYNTVFSSDTTIYAHWRPSVTKSSSTSATPASGSSGTTSPAVEGFSFKSHAGTFLVAGTMLFTLVALYAR